jgi:hypothetical protein
MKSKLGIVRVFVWAGTAFAGGRGTGSFDTDDALDWVWGLSESKDLPVVENTLKEAVDASNYLEAPTSQLSRTRSKLFGN